MEVVFMLLTVKFKLVEVVMLNFRLRVVCLLTASLITTHVLSQDISGWSDKTICRLAANQQDNPQFLQEVKKRELSCADYKVIKPNVAVPETSNGSGY